MCNITKALLHALLLLVLEIVQSLQYDLKPDQIILVIQKRLVFGCAKSFMFHLLVNAFFKKSQ